MNAGAMRGACPVGFNVIGHLSSSSGLGNTARLFIQLLQSQGYGIAAMDVDYSGESAQQPIEGIRLVKSTTELPYTYNLIIVSIQLLPSLWRRRLPGLLDPRFRNAGLVFWELPIMPNAWRPSIGLFDAILVCSPFVRHAVEAIVPDVPTLYAEHPLPVNANLDNKELARERLGIAEQAFVCCTSFDLRSDYSRKNPGATVAAFRKAFPDKEHARLVIKVNGSSGFANASSGAKTLIDSIEGDERIILVTETMCHEQVLSLYNACDAFVSLHRSEGLGLGPMEAMLLGKLVVATGFSGNMAYMTEQNSMPISYRLVKPEGSGWQFKQEFAGQSARWAEPDLDQAADAMNAAHRNPEMRILLAERGRRDIIERQETAWRGDYLPRLCRHLDKSTRSRLRDSLVRQIHIAEATDSTLRRLNIRSLFERMATISG